MATQDLLEPALTSKRDNLRGLRVVLLRQAVDIYIAHAYPSGTLPPAVERRLVWSDAPSIDGMLTEPPFERTGKAKSSGRSTPIYALRLGNHRYPHMKLQIQPWPNEAGFLLSVNTHDQLAGLDQPGSNLDAFRELQAENQRLKEVIEQLWDETGLPTFHRYLRDYINSRTSEEGLSTSANSDPGFGEPMTS
jgi:hypothetical protein